MASISNINEIIAALTAAGTAAGEASVTIVTRGQVVVENASKSSFTGAHQRGSPTTSTPGAPPDVVTGTLRRSIVSSAVQPFSDGSATGQIYPTVIYARIQELGGRGLPARPYMQPAYEQVKPRLQEIAAEEWARIIP